MARTSLPLLLTLLLLACQDERGHVGHFCLPDGSCVSEALECVDAPEWLGVPVHEPTCKIARQEQEVKAKPLCPRTLRAVARRLRCDAPDEPSAMARETARALAYNLETEARNIARAQKGKR